MTRREWIALGIVIAAFVVGVVHAWSTPGAGAPALILVAFAVIVAAAVAEAPQQ